MNAEQITRALHGKWYRSYGLACCPAHGDKRPSLSLADGTDGRLLLSCKAGCTFLEVLDALRGLGLIEGGGSYAPPNPSEIARREAEERAEAERAERRALATWREAQPIRGTIAEAYLRARGITCALPDTLRFHPDCWHPSAKRLPAMVTLIEGLPRRAIHRTYLRPDGSGKADINPTKAMLGSAAGGAVRVVGGTDGLAVAEGVETALSLACGLLRGRHTIWAALSTSGMAGLILPARPGRLIVATDGDEPGRIAGRQLAERAHGMGWSVSLLPAPDGRDWNDILTMKGATA